MLINQSIIIIDAYFIFPEPHEKGNCVRKKKNGTKNTLPHRLLFLQGEEVRSRRKKKQRTDRTKRTMYTHSMHRLRK